MSEELAPEATTTPTRKLSRSAIAAEKRAKELAKKLEDLQKRIKDVEAAKSEKEELAKRLAEESATPRKVLRAQQALIGAMIMAEWKKDPKAKEKITARLDAFYERDREREVLGLKPRKATQEPQT